MSPLSGPNFSPIGARLRVLWRILQSVRKEIEEGITELQRCEKNFLLLLFLFSFF